MLACGPLRQTTVEDSGVETGDGESSTASSVEAEAEAEVDTSSDGDDLPNLPDFPLDGCEAEVVGPLR